MSTASYVDAENDALYIIPNPPTRTPLLVAVTDSAGANNIFTSADGTTWSTRTVAEKDFQGVAYSPHKNIWVAVASDNAASGIFSSTDGVTWTARTVDSSDFAAQDAWYDKNRALFVVVGRNFTAGTKDVATSPDGITWTTQTADATVSFMAGAHSPELGYSIAIDNTAAPNQQIFRSHDGAQWTDIGVLGLASLSVTNMEWSSELQLFCLTGTDDKIATSPDGLAWTLRTSPADIDQDVAWSAEKGLFVAVGLGPTNFIATSPNGVVWTLRTNPDTDLSLSAVTYSSELELWVATGQNTVDTTGNVLTSADAITWTKRTGTAKKWVAVAAGEITAEVPAIRKWDGNRVIQQTFAWKSGQLRADYPFNLGVARVVADTYPLTFKLYNEGALKRVITVNDDDMFRLPGGFVGDYAEVEVVHTGTIRAVYVAETADELKDG